MNIPDIIKKTCDLMDEAFNCIEKMRELSHSSEKECWKYIENLSEDTIINIAFFLGTLDRKVPLNKFLKEHLEMKINKVEGVQASFVEEKDRSEKNTSRIIH